MSGLTVQEVVEAYCEEFELDFSRIDPHSVFIFCMDGRQFNVTEQPPEDLKPVWRITFSHPDLHDGEGGTIDIDVFPSNSSVRNQ